MGLPTTNRQYLAALLALITAFLNNEPEAVAPVLGAPLPHPDIEGNKIHPNGAVELPDGTLQYPNAPQGTNNDGSQINQVENKPTAVPPSWHTGTRVRNKFGGNYVMTISREPNYAEGTVACTGYTEDDGTVHDEEKMFTATDLVEVTE